MPSYEDARATITAFVRTEWVAAAPTNAPIAYDNLDFDPPEAGTVWARLNIQHLTGTRASLGGSTSAKHRRTGMMSLQVFTPIGDGTLTSDQIADAITTALEDAGQLGVTGNVWLRDIRQREVGPDGTFHQVNIEAQFTFDRAT